jgi:Mg-chelatase subunit ChlI
MAEQLSATRTISPEKVLEQLQQLAQLLRSDRIRARKGLARSEPLDKSETPASRNTTSSEDDSNKQSEFLAGYRQHFDRCLAQSVQQVIQARFTYLQEKKNRRLKTSCWHFICFTVREFP